MNTKWKRKSAYSVKETGDKLVEILGRYPTVQIVARINQHENASKNEIDIRQVECMLFQNNAYAGKIIQANYAAGFELPIRAVIWEDDQGEVWIRTTDIDYLDEHYNLNGADGAIAGIYDLLPNWLDELETKQ